MTHHSQSGLEWIEGVFGLEPHWSKEPDMSVISKIARKHLGLSADGLIDATLHSKGAFSKTYKISAPDASYLMRVSLPVDPRHRTESAVATIKFTSQNMSIPVPRIIAHSSDNSNDLGFEWILMDDIAGLALWKVWRKMSWASKEALIRQVAKYQAQTFEQKFYRIGNLYSQNEGFAVGQLATTIYYQGDQITKEVVRGPFTSSHEWLKARLQCVLADQQRIVETSCDEDEIEDAESALELAKKLLELLPTVFLPDTSASEATILINKNLSMHNIMVNADGTMTAVMDWESVPAMPLWRACRLPRLFEERTREDKPSKEDYKPDSDEEDDKDDDGLDNEGITDLYWEHLLEYEVTQLRKVFVSEMEERSPEWAIISKQGTLKDDFERAVELCDNCWSNRIVNQWVGSLGAGEPKNLSTMMFSYPDVDAMSQPDMDWEED